jgi:hypothetical protein
MKNKIILDVVFISITIIFLQGSCNKEPYKPDYSMVAGYVIGKETCNTDSTQNYWLIDLAYLLNTPVRNTPQYGDTLILNGITYTNVVKTKDLAERLKQQGMKVSIDFKTITQNKVETTGCTIENPVTYSLKEIFIINQGELH